MKFYSFYEFLKVFLLSLFRLKKYRIVFSIIIANKIELSEDARIGHFNIIIVDKLIMKRNSSIGHFNFIKGWFDLIMEEKSSIHLQNKIARILSPKNNYKKSSVHLNYHAKIGVKHEIDATSDVILDENCMLAGSGSQIWTHGFYFSKIGEKVTRIDGAVYIGKNCYVGARCIILAGVNIADAITIGANTCVSKSLDQQGLYVSQPLRYIPFDPDEAVTALTKKVATINQVDIYEK